MAARLLLDGESAYAAMTRAGFSKWTARKFTEVLTRSWLLREAIREEQERRGKYLNNPAPKQPKRPRRWDRRPIALAVTEYVTRPGEADDNARFVQKLHEDSKWGQKLNKYEKGELAEPPTRAAVLRPRCRACGGRLEGQDRWCPQCQRYER